MKKWSHVALSFCLHLCLIFAFFISPFSDRKTQSQTETIPVTFNEAPLPTNRTGSGKSSSQKGRSLKKLTSFSSQFFKAGTLSQALSTEVSGYDESRGYTLEKEGKTHAFFDALYKQIDMMMVYPDALAEKRIEGSAIIDFTVNERGEIQPSFDIVSSDHPFLETYMIAVLLNALRDPLPFNLWAKEKKNYKLALKANFKIINANSGEQLPELDTFKKNRNVFFITKTKHAEPIVTAKMKDFFEHVLPPVVIPVPGGAMINFIGIYQYIKEHDKPNLNERSKRKIEADIETWSKFIKTKATPKKS